jgi:hypothetical protein
MGESIGNFAIEIPKALNMRPQMQSITSRLDGVVKMLKHLPGMRRKIRLGGYTLKTVIKALSDANLLYRYGFLTLKDDLDSLSKAWSNARVQLQKLQVKNNAWHKVRERLFLGNDSRELPCGSPRAWPTYATTSNGYWGGFIRRSVSDAYVTLNMEVKYNLPEYNSWFIQLLALMDSVGLNANPRIAWDAMKYSFVVDWFAKVGDFLDQAKVTWLRPRVQLRNVWSASLVKYVDSIYYTRSGTLAPNAGLLIASNSVERYKRARWIPNLYRDIQMSGLSAYEIMMALSLGGSKLK